MMRVLDFYSHKNGVKSFGQTVRLFIRAVYGAAQQLAATFCQKCGDQASSSTVCAGSRDRRLIGWIARKKPKIGISGSEPSLTQLGRPTLPRLSFSPDEGIRGSV